MSALNGLQAIVVSMVIWQERERLSQLQPAYQMLGSMDAHHLQAHTKRFFLTRGWEARPHAQPAMQGGGRQAQVAVLVNFDVDDEPFGVSSRAQRWQQSFYELLMMRSTRDVMVGRAHVLILARFIAIPSHRAAAASRSGLNSGCMPDFTIRTST